MNILNKITNIINTQEVLIITISVLAIATIYLAIIAFNASQKANMISLLALESERPTILCTNKPSKPSKTTVITLKNDSKTEATNIIFLKKVRNEDLCIIDQDFSLSRDVEISFSLKFENEQDVSLIICYMNPLNNRQYLEGFNLLLQNVEKKQLDDSDGLVRYDNFLNSLKKSSLNPLKIEELIKNLSL